MALATVLPLVHLGLRAAEADDLAGVVFSDRTLGLAWATLRLALVVTVAGVLLGVGIAWLLERTQLPGRRTWAILATLPLVMPTYVAALALLSAVGPRGSVAHVPGLIGFWGAAISLTLSTYPYVLLPARAVFATTDPALEEAARALGDGPVRAFVRAVLPQLRPAVAAGSLLVFLYVLSDFGAVSMLRYETLTSGIFLEYRSFDRAPAAVLGLVLVALTLAAIALERRVRGRAAPSRVVAGARPVPRARLGWWSVPAVGALASVAALGVGVPVGVLVHWATTRRGAAEPVLGAASMTSVSLSAAAALVCVMLALPVAVLAVRYRTRFTRLVESLAFAGYALPGLVVALALVFFTARYLPAVYQTHSVVVAAYVVRFLPEALGAARTALARVDPAVEEAARSLGRPPLLAAATVTFPLVRPGLVAGAALVFLTAMKELPATLLLRPAGADTLAVRVWTGAAEGRYGQAAGPALVLVLVSALVLWPLRFGASGRSAS